MSSHTVVEPEVLESLDEAERARSAAAGRPVGCTLGPGCGCLGLPLMAVAGVFVSSAFALLWVLKLLRLPAAIVQLVARARRGSGRS